MANQHKNEVHLAGELAKDPMTRFTPTGKKVSTLTIVTKHKQYSEYHRVACWEEAAETAEKLTKGDFVKVVGRLQTRSWEDKQSGQKKYVTEVIAFQIVVPGEESKSIPPEKTMSGTEIARAILSPAKEESDDSIPF